MTCIFETDIKEYELIKRGKVRDLYDVESKILIVATDRISAFDRVLKTCIPGKGEVLTEISLFWFKNTEDIIENHVESHNLKDYPENLRKYEYLVKRSMLVKKAEVIPFEFIVRGYLAGSLYKRYIEGKTTLPEGLSEFDRLPQPMFTPTTKAEKGHDEPVTYEELKKKLGDKLAAYLRDISIRLYKRGEEIAAKKGITILDTKFEFGKIGGKVILIDEVLTPDSSRYRIVENGKVLKLDKQILRDYLKKREEIEGKMPDEIPEDVVREIQDAYTKIRDLLLG